MKIVSEQWNDYMEENDLIHTSLHGFIRKHSTATGLIEIQCVLTEALERGEYVAFIAIDCTTPHCMLLRVTKMLGCINDELE